MRNVVKLAVYAGMGLYDRLRDVVDDLVKRGELMQHEGEELLTEAKSQETARTKGLQERVETALRAAIEKVPMPASARDVAALEERIRALEAKLAEAPAEEPAAA
jgi:polyhydroxyalkanoate synthesis regulator phasin